MQNNSQYCCENFNRATKSGTDNERYGPAINTSHMQKGFEIGAIEDLISYCPWCGEKL